MTCGYDCVIAGSGTVALPEGAGLLPTPCQGPHGHRALLLPGVCHRDDGATAGGRGRDPGWHRQVPHHEQGVLQHGRVADAAVTAVLVWHDVGECVASCMFRCKETGNAVCVVEGKVSLVLVVLVDSHSVRFNT